MSVSANKTNSAESSNTRTLKAILSSEKLQDLHTLNKIQASDSIHNLIQQE